MSDEQFDELKQMVREFRTSVSDEFDSLNRRIDDLARYTQDGSLNVLERIRTMETAVMNELRAQSKRTTRIEQRLNRLEGAA